MLPTILGISPTEVDLKDQAGVYLFLDNKNNHFYIGATNRVTTAVNTITKKLEKHIGKFKHVQKEDVTIHQYPTDDIEHAISLLRTMEETLPNVTRL